MTLPTLSRPPAIQRNTLDGTNKQVALLSTESVKLEFTEEAVREIARVAALVNRTVENIGARRLHTVLERIVEVGRRVGNRGFLKEDSRSCGCIDMYFVACLSFSFNNQPRMAA